MALTWVRSVDPWLWIARPWVGDRVFGGATTICVLDGTTVVFEGGGEIRVNFV